MPLLYGYLNQRDLYDIRVTEANVEEITTLVDQSFAAFEAQMRLINGIFVMPTTKFKTRFHSVTSARLQPLDADGRARPVKPSGSYDLSFPIQMGGHAWGGNYVTEKKMRIGDVARNVMMGQTADMRWMRDHILAGLFYKSSTNPWTFDDPEHGSLSIYGLANGDSQVYQVSSGADAGTTDDHLKGATAVTAAVFADIREEIEEHPENSGPIIAFVASNLVTTIQGISTFYPVTDEDLRIGANVTELTGTLDYPFPGEIIGKCEEVWIVRWRSLPSSYIVAVSTGGDKPLAMREDEEEELRGFREVADRNDHPWYEKQYIRRAGFGAWNRVGAVVYFIDAGNAYAVPSGYSSPMG